MEPILMINTKGLYPKSREVYRKQAYRCAPHYVFKIYKIVYSLVATPLPSYFVHPEVYTRHMHPLSGSYRQIHISVCYYQYSFSPCRLFFGTSYQLISSLFLILTHLKQESVRSIMYIPKASSPVLFLIGF